MLTKLVVYHNLTNILTVIFYIKNAYYLLSKCTAVAYIYTDFPNTNTKVSECPQKVVLLDIEGRTAPLLHISVQDALSIISFFSSPNQYSITKSFYFHLSSQDDLYIAHIRRKVE